MRYRKHSAKTTDNPGPKASHQPSKRQSRTGWGKFAFAVLAFVLVLIAGRLVLPWVVRSYVNRTLDRNPLYAGTIGPVRIHLWRGAYSIEQVRISKTTANVPVPFFSADRVDFGVQWDALLHGSVVGRVLMVRPVINFVDAPAQGESQSGAGGPWLKLIRDLFPFRINRAVIQDGSVHFRVFQTPEPVDVYLSQVDGTVDNLTNIRNETNPLISTVRMNALVMDQARLEFVMTMDPFSYRPTFHLATRLLGLDVTRINDLARAYGKFDFERGWFDLVVEADSKEGQITGYIKPLFRNLQVFSLTEDIKGENVLQFFWQALVGAATSVLKNFPRDQFGTLIPFTADASGKVTTDILATIGNVLRNAFIRAYLPRLQSGAESVGELQFSPPDLTSPISVGDTGQ